MKYRLILITLALLSSACNIQVTSFAPPPAQPLPPPTEAPPTPYPDTPAPGAISAAKVEAPAFLDIDFLDELDGWALSETQVLRTNDGGLTWYNVTPPDLKETGSNVGIFILDKTHAWLQKPDFNNFPNNGLLYRTSDGGLTWTFSSTPFSGGDLSFLDANHGWMLADLGVGAGSNAVAVFQTKDGGATWTQTYSNDPDNPGSSESLPLGGLKSALVPLSMRTAWATGVTYASGSLYLYRTDDGGQTWSLVTPQLPAGAETSELAIDRGAMQFVTPRDGFLVVRMAGESTLTVVYTTQDAGKTWTLMPAVLPNAGKTAFLSAQQAVLYNGQQFYVTRDAARTWTSVSPNLVFGDSFSTMDFVNLTTGWVLTRDASGHRSLYRTNDGGATWLPLIP